MNKLLLSIAALVMSVCMYANDVVFDFDNDYATLFPSIQGTSSNDSHDGDITETVSATVDGITFSVQPAESGTANRIWYGNPKLRIYSGSFSITSAGDPVTYIKFTTGSNWNISSVDNGSLSEKEWTGNSNEVTFSVSKNTQISKIEVSTSSGHVVLTTLYSIAFTSSQEGWTVDDKDLGDLQYVWKPSTSYGYVASAFTDKCYPSESWLMSPVYDMSNASQLEMTVNHAGNKFAGAVSDQVQYCITTDGGNTWNPLQVEKWPAGNSWAFNESAVDISQYAGKANVQMAIIYKSTEASAGSYEISNMTIKGVGSISVIQTKPAGPTITPATGTYEDDQTVTITEPSGNNYTIYYTLDGSEPSESSTIYNDPFVVTQTTTVKAVYVDDDDNMSAVSTAIITINKTVGYSTIAELIRNCTATSSGNAPSVSFNITNLLVTGVNGSNVFVADNTGAFLLYGSGSNLKKGDVISGTITGKLYSYNGLPELAVSDKWESISKKEESVAVTPVTMKAADITAADASKYVRLEGLQLVSAEEVSGKTNYTLTDGTNEVIIRDQFNCLAEAFVEGQTYNVNMFVIPFKETIQYYVIGAEDVESASANKADVNGDGIVDTQDVLAIYTVISESSNKKFADVNGDGVVDTQDVLSVYDYIQNH